jgi:hypothetical protein
MRVGNKRNMKWMIVGVAIFQIASVLNAQAVPQLTEEQQKVLDLADKYVSQYKQNISDYLFTQKTCHYLDKKGIGTKWKKTGCIQEEVSFLYDYTADSKVLNGNPPPNMSWSKTLDYLVVPQCVFGRDSTTKSVPEIAWQREENIDGRRIFVFSYRVPSSGSPLYIADSEKDWGTVGFHGLAFLECATGAVVRVENEIEAPSGSRHYRLIKSVIDFGLFNIQETEYMLPAKVQSYLFVEGLAMKLDTVVTKCRKFAVKTNIKF